MTVLKARVGADWVTIGGAAAGVPAGGTTGQILTKTSAADYATAWSSTPPILANNTYLQGYRADGTTAQNLIGLSAANALYVGTDAPGGVVVGQNSPGALYFGVGGTGVIQIGLNAQNDISIGSGLAVGKNIYVPRLTVQGPLTLGDQQWLESGSAQLVLYNSSINNMYVAHNCNFHVNVSAGTTIFYKNITVYDTIYKGGSTAYTHPDFVFEHHFTGGIERFRDAPGADTYEGLWPLARVEEFAQEHWRLPGHAARENDRVDIFRRTHDLLAELERVYLHLFDHEKRLTALENG